MLPLSIPRFSPLFPEGGPLLGLTVGPAYKNIQPMWLWTEEEVHTPGVTDMTFSNQKQCSAWLQWHKGNNRPGWFHSASGPPQFRIVSEFMSGCYVSAPRQIHNRRRDRFKMHFGREIMRLWCHVVAVTAGQQMTEQLWKEKGDTQRLLLCQCDQSDQTNHKNV